MNRVRQETQELRSFVINEQNGKCGVCCKFQPFILEVHHIISVSNGGDAYRDNLVALCPNCHSVIEKLRTRKADNPYFNDWIKENYTSEEYKRISIYAGFGWSENDDY